MTLKTTRRCAVPSCGKTQSLHCLPPDPNIRKEWMNFILNVPVHVSKNLAQFDTGFSERLKRKDDAVGGDYIGSDSNVATQNCFYYVVTFALSVKQSI